MECTSCTFKYLLDLYFKVLRFFLLFCCVINLLRCLGAEAEAGAGPGEGAEAEAGAGAGAGAGTD